MNEEERAVCEAILNIGRRMYAKNMVVSNLDDAYWCL